MKPVARIAPGNARRVRSGLRPRRAWARGIPLLLAVALVATGCGYKTPLEIPKKPAPTRPAP
ncbi:MAG: LPS translocon maturation chaperone LptM [Pseudomonadota bacterium]